jgi:hypothetical protein
MFKRTYSDVFSGLGCIGDPVHTKLNTSVRPVQSGIRRYPVNKTQKISKIYMDPARILNMAIERPLYPMPLLEENLPHFTLADAL